MPATPSTFTVRVVPDDQKERTSFMEFARLRGEYLYDKVFILSFAHNIDGIVVHFDYERNSTRMRELPVTQVSPQDWAVARQDADRGTTPEAKRDTFGQTALVARLFADGARHYNEANVKAEVSFAADAAFLATIGPIIPA